MSVPREEIRDGMILEDDETGVRYRVTQALAPDIPDCWPTNAFELVRVTPPEPFRQAGIRAACYSVVAVAKEELWAEFIIWARGRPPVVQELMVDWPPGCAVRAKPGVVLLVPGPGVEGHVGSYFENGLLGVVAPITIPHPEYGWGSATPGDLASAECSPDDLEFVRAAPWTSEDVRRALA